MLRLQIDNSLCRIEGLNPTEFKSLRDVLSYDIADSAAYYTGSCRPTKRYLIDRRGVFPSGLLYLVEKWLEPSRVQVERIDQRKVPPARDGLFTLTLPFDPYPSQYAAVEAAVKSHRCIVSAPTGFGKSVLIAMLIHRLQVPTLLIVPSLELKFQLTESLREFFGTGIVGPLKTGSGWTPIAVENIAALDLSKPVKNYDALIVDEGHHVAASSYRRLNARCWNGIYFRYCFTATPFRNRSEEQILFESIAGKVAYKITHKEAVASGAIVPVEAYFFDLPKRKVTGTSWAQVYGELVVKNHERNVQIASLLRRLAADAPTLCLCKEIAHGVALSALSGVGFVNGQDEESRLLIKEFNAGRIQALIGTVGVLGEGIDTRPAEHIIVAGLGKSKPAFLQNCGRGFRRYPEKESAKIFIFRDPSHRFALSHFNAQVKYLKEEYGVTAVKIS